jgi:hypothetical protein
MEVRMLRFTQRRRAMLLAAATAAGCSIGIGAGAARGQGALPASVALGTTGDGVLDFVYDPSNGDLSLQFDGDSRISAAHPLQIIRMKSASGLFTPEAFNTTAFQTWTTNSSTLNGSATALNAIPDHYDFGLVLPAGLQAAALTSDLSLIWNTYGGGLYPIKEGDVVFGSQPVLPLALKNVYTAGTGNWSTPGSWSLGVAPRSGDSAVLSPTSGAAVVTLDAAIPATAMANVVLDAKAGVSVTLAQRDAASALSAEYAYLGYSTNSTGTYELGGGSWHVSFNEYIGYKGAGTFTQTGGTHSVGAVIAVGNTPGTEGVLNVTGGSVTTMDLRLGWMGGSGTVNVGPGGVLSTSRYVTVNTPDSVLNLSGGTVNASWFGVSSWSGLRFMSGTLNVRNNADHGSFPGLLSIGAEGGGGRATWNQVGGSFTADGMVLGSGFDTAGMFVLSGSGAMTVNGVAQVVNSLSGIYLNGGTLTAGSLDLGGDPSRLHWTAGNLVLTGGVNIGAGGPFGSAVVVPAGKAFTLAENSSVSAGSSLGVTGGSLTAQTLVNDGALVVSAGAASAGALAGGGSTTVGTPAGSVTAAGVARPAAAATGVALSVGNFAQSSAMIGDGGTLAVQPAATVAMNSVATLQIAPSGLLDLGNQPLMVDRVGTPVGVVEQYLRNGYRSGPQTGVGDWAGRGGITSSDAMASHQPGGSFKVSVGYLDGAIATTLGPIPGQSGVPLDKVFVRPALYGDLNLDGKVDDVDLQIFSGLGQYGKASNACGWLGGDLNYDGKVDDRDLQIFSGAGNYNGPSYGAAAAGPTAVAGLTVSHTLVGKAGDQTLDLEYDPATGDLKLRVDGDPSVSSASPLQVLRLTSASGHFVSGNFDAAAFGGFARADGSELSGTILGGGGLADGYDLGRVLPAGWTAEQVAADVGFAWNTYGGGMGLRAGDVTVAGAATPEPSGVVAAAGAYAVVFLRRRRRRR